MSGNRIGVYLCRCGGNISDVVDTEAVAAAVKDSVSIVRVEDYLCSSAGQGAIEQDIREGKVDRVVIGSCSPKLHLGTFRNMAQKAGMDPMLLEITNLREQDSWVHPGDPQAATDKAASLIKGAAARMSALESLQPMEKLLVDSVLVVGGGIAGITAALELADDHPVVLVEREPYIGGHMIGLSKTFPTFDCSQCTLTPKMVAVHNHPNITLHIQTTVVDTVAGSPGDYTVTLLHAPRYVDVEACTSCGRCAEACPKDAIYLPFAQAVPQAYIVDKEKCIDCGRCEKVCPVDAIDIKSQAWKEEIGVGAVVIATGFSVFDVSRIEEYNTTHPDIITAVQFEEMLSAKSRTGMRLVRSDGTMPQKVAFVLCVGSRDFERYNKHCSRVCCLYSMKQAHLVKKMNKDAQVSIFYIDMRAAGRRFEEFYYSTQQEGVQFIRGRIASITPAGGQLKVGYEDTLLGTKEEDRFDMVVLCPSLEASQGSRELAQQLSVPVGEDGFIEEKHVKIDPVSSLNQAVYMAGCALGPKDIHDTVTDGISAAHKVHQFLGRGKITVSPEKPVINDRCNECGICIAECPYGALSGPGRPTLEALACTGCGICAAVCPKQAVDIQNYTREQIRSQIRGMHEPGVIVFIDPAAYAAADLAGMNRIVYSSKIRFVQVPSIHILDADIVNFALEQGAEGVMLVEGTTDERLTRRSKDLYSMLKKATRQHKKPIRYSHVETAQYEKMGNLFNVFVEQLKD